MVITIDGPAGSGKSTVAKAIAERTHFSYLDSGAFYRVLGLYLLARGVPPQSGAALDAALVSIHPTITTENNRFKLLLNGDDLYPLTRSEEAARAASLYSALPEVRAFLLTLQRDAARVGDLVCDGRDMGSVVFPNADFKFFLDASPEIRAARRVSELEALGQSADYETILADIQSRDLRDRTRAVAPLCIPDGATLIDTSTHSPEKVVSLMLLQLGLKSV